MEYNAINDQPFQFQFKIHSNPFFVIGIRPLGWSAWTVAVGAGDLIIWTTLRDYCEEVEGEELHPGGEKAIAFWN